MKEYIMSDEAKISMVITKSVNKIVKAIPKSQLVQPMDEKRWIAGVKVLKNKNMVTFYVTSTPNHYVIIEEIYAQGKEILVKEFIYQTHKEAKEFFDSYQ